MGLGLNKLLDFSKCIHPKVCILQCFGMNKLLGQILAVGRAIRTKSLSLFVLFVADSGVNGSGSNLAIGWDLTSVSRHIGTILPIFLSWTFFDGLKACEASFESKIAKY